MTKRTLYSLINQHAKRWWYYADLRKKGQLAEARKLERDSIRREVANLRACKATPGGHIGLGRGGASIYTKDCRVSGGDNTYYRELGLHVGLPIIDSTTITNDAIYETVSLPMVAVGRGPDPKPETGYGALDYAPLEYVAGLYLALGATIHNLQIDPAIAACDLRYYRKRKEAIRAAMEAKPKPEPIRKPTVTAEGKEIDLEDLEAEGADGACLACGEYAYGVEPDATGYTCESCGAKQVMGAENILIIYS
jgi:hypothetical protein